MAWFKEWFNTPYYHLLYNNRDFSEAESFITKLTQFLQLPAQAEIIDLACGKGRHSVFLNRLGFKVLGLDLSEESIQHNKQFENENLQFDVHDMRDPIDYHPVDAVFNLFTSFGYFDDPKDDRKVFTSVHKILKKGGIFVLDFLNERYVENTLVPKTTVEKEGINFQISKRIEDQHVIKDIRFSDQDEDFHFFEKVKLHTAEEIEELALSEGFERIKVFGNYKLEEFDSETSPRCISIFKKSER